MKGHPFYQPSDGNLRDDELQPDLPVEEPEDVDPEAERRKREIEEQAARDQLREEARREGLEQGRKQGFEKGVADARSVVEPLIARLTETMEQLDTALSGARNELAQRIRDLGVDFAEALVASPGLLDRQALLRQLLQEAEDERSAEAHIVCRLHPDTADDLAPLLQDIAVERDTALQPDGIIVETRNADFRQAVTRWDASIERQIETLRGLKTTLPKTAG